MAPLNLSDFTPTMPVPVFTPYSDFGLHQLHYELQPCGHCQCLHLFCFVLYLLDLRFEFFTGALGILIVRLQNALHLFADGFPNLVWSYQMALLWLSFLPGSPPSFLGKHLLWVSCLLCWPSFPHGQPTFLSWPLCRNSSVPLILSITSCHVGSISSPLSCV